MTTSREKQSPLLSAIAGGVVISLFSFLAYVLTPEQNCFTDVTGTHCEQTVAQSGSFIVAVLTGGVSLVLAGFYALAKLLSKARDVTEQ